MGSLARFSHGSSVRKMAPELGALVKVAPEKPTKLTPCSTPGVLSASSIARRWTSSVRASDAPGGKLDHDDEIAAVDLRDEADRRLAELVEAVGDDADIDEQHDHGVADHARGDQAVEVAEPVEAPIEQPEEAARPAASTMATR